MKLLMQLRVRVIIIIGNGGELPFLSEVMEKGYLSITTNRKLVTLANVPVVEIYSKSIVFPRELGDVVVVGVGSCIWIQELIGQWEH